MEKPLGFITDGTKFIAFPLSKMVSRELDYGLIKELWAYTGNRIAVRSLRVARRFGSTGIGPMATRTGSFIDDGLMAHVASSRPSHLESDRKYHWVLGAAPEDHQVKRSWPLVLLSFISMRVSNSQISAIGPFRFSES